MKGTGWPLRRSGIGLGFSPRFWLATIPGAARQAVVARVLRPGELFA
jgi:hypothetical protein